MMELLSFFLSEEKTLLLQKTSLRCLGFILSRGVHFNASTDLNEHLLGILKDPKFPPALQVKALLILHKMLIHVIPTISCMDMLEFSKLLEIFEKVIQSQGMTNRLLAARVLIDLCCKLLGRVEMASHGVGLTLTSQVIALLMDHISSLVTLKVDHQSQEEMEKEVKSLVSLVLHLIECCPCLGALLLEKVSLFTKTLVSMLEKVVRSRKANSSAGDEFREIGGQYKIFISSKLMVYLFRIMVTCLENSREAAVETTKLLGELNPLVEHVDHCNLLDSYTHGIFSLLLHSCIANSCTWKDLEGDGNPKRKLCISHNDSFFQPEIRILECAKRLIKKDNWSAYKVGKYAACQGAWFVAAFIFEKLVMMGQSDTCYCWLKCLAQFAQSEMKLQLLLLPEQGFDFLDQFEIDKLYVTPLKDICRYTDRASAFKMLSPEYIKYLVGACHALQSSSEMAGAIIAGHSFNFQRWFLALRGNVLETIVDVLKLFGAVSVVQNEIENSERLSEQTTSFVYPLTHICFRFKRLAQEYDLISTSFFGMDTRSHTNLLALALSCSLLAFTTGLAVLIPNPLASRSSTICSLENSKDCLHLMLMQDLVGRLWHIDPETSRKILTLVKVYGQPTSCSLNPCKFKVPNTGHQARDIVTLCRYAVMSITRLHDEANSVQDVASLSRISNNGLHLILDIMMNWLHIPFFTPSHFFRVRSCVSSELFVISNGSKNSEVLSVLAGCHLSLSLCIQLKNMLPHLPSRPNKLYCILHCEKSSEGSAVKKQMSGLSFGTEDMVHLNEMLFHYVMGHAKQKRMLGKYTADDCGGVTAYLCFELNQRGQGFATCLLDVSAFPVGSYRIKWHSGFFDVEGHYWSLLPLNAGPVFAVQEIT